MDALSPDDLADRLVRGDPLTLLDVRDRPEIDAWRIDGPGVRRVEVPYARFVAAGVSGSPADLLPEGAPEPVVAVCPRGEASDEVAAGLREDGVDAVNLEGGMRGWARVYRRVELDADAGGATVYQYQRPSSGCLAYLVVAGGEALVVDPLRAFADHYRTDAETLGVNLVAAVDTHVHADHVSGLRDVGDGVATFVSEAAVARGITYGVSTIAGGDELRLGGATLEVVATPGHTTGMVSLRVGDVLLCGDTLFVDGVPRPDLQAEAVPGTGDDGAASGDPGTPGPATVEARARDLHRTLTERLARFGDETVVAPGHVGPDAQPVADGSYTATLGDLRERLWAFDVDADAFAARLAERTPPPPANVETILAVNLGRESADDATAFELELGPNNCAAAAD